MDEPMPKHWYEIPWPIQGYQPCFEMPHEIYDELVEEYPNVDVEQELINAYGYMKQRFPDCTKVVFTKFILNWMSRNERLNRKTNQWFGGAAVDGGSP